MFFVHSFVYLAWLRTVHSLIGLSVSVNNDYIKVALKVKIKYNAIKWPSWKSEKFAFWKPIGSVPKSNMHGFWEQCVVLFPKFHVVLSPIVDALLGSIFLSDFSLLFPWCRTKKRNLHLNICYQTVWVRRCKTPTSAKPNHSFHVSFYSGTTKETPELKFRLRFFFVRSQIAVKSSSRMRNLWLCRMRDVFTHEHMTWCNGGQREV